MKLILAICESWGSVGSIIYRTMCTTFLLVFATSIALGTRGVKPLTPPELEGRWVGEYQLGNKTTFMVLAFGADKNRWNCTYNRPAIDWEEFRDLRSFRIGADSLEFQLGRDASPFGDENPNLAFQLKLKQDEFDGSVSDGRYQGRVHLIHLASLEKGYLDSLTGDYRLPDGSFLIIERENRYLCFLERRTGRTGRLMPRSRTEFWSGPTLDIWYPPLWRFEFRSDACCRNNHGSSATER